MADLAGIPKEELTSLLQLAIRQLHSTDTGIRIKASRTIGDLANVGVWDPSSIVPLRALFFSKDKEELTTTVKAVMALVVIGHDPTPEMDILLSRVESDDANERRLVIHVLSFTSVAWSSKELLTRLVSESLLDGNALVREAAKEALSMLEAERIDDGPVPSYLEIDGENARTDDPIDSSSEGRGLEGDGSDEPNKIFEDISDQLPMTWRELNSCYLVGMRSSGDRCAICGKDIPPGQLAYIRNGDWPETLCYDDFEKRCIEWKGMPRGKQRLYLLLSRFQQGPILVKELRRLIGNDYGMIIKQLEYGGYHIRKAPFQKKAGTGFLTSYRLLSQKDSSGSDEIPTGGTLDEAISAMRRDAAVAMIINILHQNGVEVIPRTVPSVINGTDLNDDIDNEIIYLKSAKGDTCSMRISCVDEGPEVKNGDAEEVGTDFIVNISRDGVRCMRSEDLQDPKFKDPRTHDFLGDRYELGLQREVTVTLCHYLVKMLYADMGVSEL